MPINPFYEQATDGSGLIELKQGIVIYVRDPPSPAKARLVYDYYFNQCGNRVRVYRSTLPNSSLKTGIEQLSGLLRIKNYPLFVSAATGATFFSDHEDRDSWLFMFHGFRPYSEASKASFYRFDFDWQVDPGFLMNFAQGLIEIVPCLSGFGGYYLQGRIALERSSYNRMFALARRYWGIEAHNLDITVNHMLQGYKCVNWLTIIGEEFRHNFPEAIDNAKQAAHSYHETPHATLFKAKAFPAFCDRNRYEVLDGYVALANALLPIQVKDHGAFGGDYWDDNNTMTYLRRFTHPDEVV